MSIRRESSTTNDNTVQKGGGLDVSVGNPGMHNDTDTYQQPNYSQGFNRGSDIGSVTAGTDEAFTARTKLYSDDHDIMNFQFDAPGSTVDKTLFIADREMRLVSATARISTAGGSGYTVTIKKASSGTAIGSGTAITSAQALTGVSTDTNLALTVTEADAVVTEGQAVGLDLGGTVGSAANLTFTLVFRRVLEPGRLQNFVE